MPCGSSQQSHGNLETFRWGSVCNWQSISGVILCSGQDAGRDGYVTVGRELTCSAGSPNFYP